MATHRILIVEDEDANRALFERILAAAGYEVEGVSNGKAAVEAYDRQAADVVLTDILMPDHEGLEMIRAMRRRHPDVKIIAISGASPYLAMAKKFGAAQTLAKPFSKKELLDAVAAVLGTAPSDTAS